MYEVNKDSNFGDEKEYLIIFQGRRYTEWYDEANRCIRIQIDECLA